MNPFVHDALHYAMRDMSFIAITCALFRLFDDGIALVDQFFDHSVGLLLGACLRHGQIDVMREWQLEN